MFLFYKYKQLTWVFFKVTIIITSTFTEIIVIFWISLFCILYLRNCIFIILQSNKKLKSWYLVITLSDPRLYVSIKNEPDLVDQTERLHRKYLFFNC